MATIVVRMDDGLAGRLKERAGRGGVNRAVVGLIEGWLGGEGEIVVPAGLKHDWTKVGAVRASELPTPEIPEGAICGYQVRGGICGKPAKFTRGPLFRCEEH